MFGENLMRKFDAIISLVTFILLSSNVYSDTKNSIETNAVGQPGDANQVSRTVKLTQVDNMFLPDEMTIKEGETIRFVVKNGGNKKHEMLIGSKEDLKKAAHVRRMYPDREHTESYLLQLEPGEQKELIWHFAQVGTVEYACPLPGHFKKMRGTIIVERK